LCRPGSRKASGKNREKSEFFGFGGHNVTLVVTEFKD